MKKMKIATLVVLMPLVAACANRLPHVAENPPSSGAFEKALHQGYVGLAQAEIDEYDWSDGGKFTKRADMLSNGNMVLPEEIAMRDLPADRVSVLTSSRARLMKAIDAGLTSTYPDQLARAQVAFDCWMQEQEENRQPADIEACQKDFIAAMEEVEAAEKAKTAKSEPAPTPAAAPAPTPASLPEGIAIYFDFDSANLGGYGNSVVEDAASVFTDLGATSVTLSAYADRSGDTAYNDALAARRGEAVRDALIANGVSADAITVEVLGEREQVFATEDGVREARNRSVLFNFAR
ncbi:OmpA family protein [Rhodospirillaceae bacterium RKSG073]|nr:OmpA family protein [Curvivirga aplysinae]